MAQIIWTEPAVAELDSIADYIALDNPEAAREVVGQVISTVRQLARFPKSGSRVPEWPRSSYRQLVVPPCRIFYRVAENKIVIVFVIRHERLLKKKYLTG